jgi:hypothetical protein
MILSLNCVKTFDPKGNVPHVLVELSQIEHKQLIYSSIHLEEIYVYEDTDMFLFEKVTYGKNI